MKISYHLIKKYIHNNDYDWLCFYIKLNLEYGGQAFFKNISSVSKKMKVSRPTCYKFISKLIQEHFLIEYDNGYEFNFKFKDTEHMIDINNTNMKFNLFKIYLKLLFFTEFIRQNQTGELYNAISYEKIGKLFKITSSQAYDLIKQFETFDFKYVRKVKIIEVDLKQKSQTDFKSLKLNGVFYQPQLKVWQKKITIYKIHNLK